MALFEPVFEALEKSGARYVVVGGVAVVLHGYARMTADLDLVIDWESSTAGKAVSALVALGLRPRAPVDPMGLLDAGTRKTWREEKGMMVFSFTDSKNPMFTVDLFLEPPLPFQDLWSHSRSVSIGGGAVRIAAIPDLIVLKTRAGRPQDLADIEALEILAQETKNG
ncbi:MAG: hypothetical protein A2V88_14140 [Elusimicrobia bacterium RBG_16_66_12]|nr:MAG: hypothetical protein A2V88_14140 [Elusimicrobia bacterium RBG_16_66_12]